MHAVSCGVIHKLPTYLLHHHIHNENKGYDMYEMMRGSKQPTKLWQVTNNSGFTKTIICFNWSWRETYGNNKIQGWQRQWHDKSITWDFTSHRELGTGSCLESLERLAGHDSFHRIPLWSLHGPHGPCCHVLGRHSTFLLQQVSGTRWCSQTTNDRIQSQISYHYVLERWMCSTPSVLK
jgi:hypothetical protein